VTVSGHSPVAAKRIVLVHAHPDDESIATGATMAYYAARGVHVTLVTCTLGEEGEVHMPELAELSAAEADQLGGYRLTELRAACAALGVADHRILGMAGRYRDSGMMGLPTNNHPRAFWQADVDAAAAALVEIFREIRPQVLVTYDENGFYGHPDHIQAHRVAMRAAALAGEEGLAPQKVYWTATPRSLIESGFDAFAKSEDNPFAGVEKPEDIPFGTPDDQIAARIDAREYADHKLGALHAHATQIPPNSWLYVLAGSFGADFLGVEHYTLAQGVKGPTGAESGLEDDLFAGVELPAPLPS
jgi:N-acetyl-1-D-myo-inositol-2-amino-2-deoxy-alpha-D-glucopyranoside deacetylase